MRDPRSRFTDRVADYVRARPGYPQGLVELLRRRRGLSASDRIADVGCGTGKLAECFLEHGHPVIGVEPKAAMREAAERLLRSRNGFSIGAGSAERTGLADRSVDVVAAGQAFHWFDALRSREEFRRILVPQGLIVLVWNHRRTAANRLMGDYERLLELHGTDYREVDPQRFDEAAIREFFGESGCELDLLPNAQQLDRGGLQARVFSSSYVPGAGQPGHEELRHAVDALFDAHAIDDAIVLEYDTRIWHGRLAV